MTSVVQPTRGTAKFKSSLVEWRDDLRVVRDRNGRHAARPSISAAFTSSLPRAMWLRGELSNTATSEGAR